MYTPDDIMDGRVPGGEVLVFDHDHYYMGPVLALQLAAAGARVRYVTTEGRAGAWSLFTQEQERTQRALIELGVEIEVITSLDGFDGAEATLACVFTGRLRRCVAAAAVPVTAREPDEALYRELVGEDGVEPEFRRIGDCQAPGLIANAVYSGHRAARELGGPTSAPRRERVLIQPA